MWFDTVVNYILIDRLQTVFSIHGTVLSWMSSLLKDRTQTVTVAGARSNTSAVKSFVPQGSVQSTHYWRALISSYRKAEDLESSIPLLVSCMDWINCRMSANHLQLKTDRTQIILSCTRQQLVKVKRKSISLAGVEIPFSDDDACVGVVLDNELK